VNASTLHCNTILWLGPPGTRVAVACVGSEVVGVAAWAGPAPADVARLRSDFALDCAAAEPICLEAIAVNPIFEPHTAAFLAATLRLAAAAREPSSGSKLSGASSSMRPFLSLSAALDSAPPPCVSVAMVQAVPQRRQAACEQASSYPLHVYTPSLAPRGRVHSRVSIALKSGRAAGWPEGSSAHQWCCDPPPGVHTRNMHNPVTILLDPCPTTHPSIILHRLWSWAPRTQASAASRRC
jgi:hypothetical protein